MYRTINTYLIYQKHGGVRKSKKSSKYSSNKNKINHFLKEEKKISNKDFDKFNLRMENSKKSLQLFRSAGFTEIGIRKDWSFRNGKFQDVIEFQFINK